MDIMHIIDAIENGDTLGTLYAKAYADGRADYNDGATLADNPYQLETQIHRVWTFAWIEQRGYTRGRERDRTGKPLPSPALAETPTMPESMSRMQQSGPRPDYEGA